MSFSTFFKQFQLKKREGGEFQRSTKESTPYYARISDLERILSDKEQERRNLSYNDFDASRNKSKIRKLDNGISKTKGGLRKLYTEYGKEEALSTIVCETRDTTIVNCFRNGCIYGMSDNQKKDYVEFVLNAPGKQAAVKIIMGLLEEAPAWMPGAASKLAGLNGNGIRLSESELMALYEFGKYPSLSDAHGIIVQKLVKEEMFGAVARIADELVEKQGAEYRRVPQSYGAVKRYDSIARGALEALSSLAWERPELERELRKAFDKENKWRIETLYYTFSNIIGNREINGGEFSEKGIEAIKTIGIAANENLRRLEIMAASGDEKAAILSQMSGICAIMGDVGGMKANYENAVKQSDCFFIHDNFGRAVSSAMFIGAIKNENAYSLQLEAAIKALEKALPGDINNCNKSIAYLYLKEGDAGKALESVNKLSIEKVLGNDDATRLKAEILVKLGKLEEAIDIINSHIRYVREVEGKTVFMLLDLYLQSGMKEDALALALKAIGQGKTDISVAMAFLENGNYDDAVFTLIFELNNGKNGSSIDEFEKLTEGRWRKEFRAYVRMRLLSSLAQKRNDDVNFMSIDKGAISQEKDRFLAQYFAGELKTMLNASRARNIDELDGKIRAAIARVGELGGEVTSVQRTYQLFPNSDKDYPGTFYNVVWPDGFKPLDWDKAYFPAGMSRHTFYEKREGRSTKIDSSVLVDEPKM